MTSSLDTKAVVCALVWIGSRFAESSVIPCTIHLFDSHGYPRFLNRLATVFSILIIPCLIAVVVLPFLTAWWTFLPSLALAWVFLATSYRYQREAVRQLVLEDAHAYKFLFLEGVIVVGGEIAIAGTSNVES